MKEEDIRKREVTNRYLELVEADAREIFRDRSTFQQVPCPACLESEAVPQFEKAGFRYVQCCRCNTLYLNPRPTFEHLMQIYTDSPSTRYWVEEFFMPVLEVRREKIFRPRAEFITSRFPQLRKGRIADIGAGFGLFLEEVRKLWPDVNLTAIEPSRDMANICRKAGLNVIEAMLEDVDEATGKYDLLTSFELFEHLHDPERVLESISRLLVKGGYLYLTTLNGLGFDIQLLWDKSKSVSPPHHVNFFNPSSMRELLGRTGYEVVDISTPGELDWDIVEGAWRHEGKDPGRFFRTFSENGSAEAKNELQAWIQRHNLSSHMRVVARKI